MEIEHNPQADMMYIRLNHKPFHKNQVFANGLVVADLAEDGAVIGFELISPSLYVENTQEITYRLDNMTTSPAE